MNRLIPLAVLGLLVLGGLFLALRPEGSGSGPQSRTIDVSIQGDSMTPGTISAKRNDELTLRFTADHALELHLHGYDQELELRPNERQELKLKADREGSFEIENEGTGVHLGRLTVEPR